MSGNNLTNPGIFTHSGNDLDSIAQKMEKVVGAADTEVTRVLDQFGKDEDPKAINAAELANVQMAMNKWSISYSLTASSLRTIKDMMSGIIQKI